MAGGEACERSECRDTRAELEAVQMRTVQLQAEIVALEGELAEALKLIELQKADLDRYEKAIQDARPHCPERTSDEQLQLGWVRILQALAEEPSNDGDEAHEALEKMPPPGGGEGRSRSSGKGGRHAHGRRPPADMAKLPQRIVEVDPPEVLAAGGEGYRYIGVETSRSIAYRPSSYICVTIKRRKYARIEEATPDLSSAGLEQQPLPPVVIAELPDCVWPRFMADPSAVANVIVTKYGDVVPLNRQETISARHGLSLSRSTLCGWLSKAHAVLYRIVDAMLSDAKRSAHCIATDATGAPVKKLGGHYNWHVFVFIADADHVIFRYATEHTSHVIAEMLVGYEGVVLADASLIFDTLFRDLGMTESGCWSHARRYFWKGVETERDRAYEALALIAQLFAIERDCKDLTPDERQGVRLARAGPVLAALDQWVDRHRDDVAPRGRIRAAITYYDNQREALHRFVHDGRLSIHNNASERALRNLVLGRANWQYFANRTGLNWYTVFRSLIASCALHDINPQAYLEQVLRLAPHWPVTRMLELAPKYWKATLAALDEQQQLIITPPWELDDQVVSSDSDDVAA